MPLTPFGCLNKHSISVGLTMLLCITISVKPMAQPRNMVYLGDRGDSIFSTAVIVRHDNGLTCPQLEMAGYRTFSHTAIINNVTEDINRLGIILPAKTTDAYHRLVQAYFGKEMDTCCVDYEVKILAVTNGRSATVSLLNLFSKDKAPQDDPVTQMKQVLVSGQLIVQDKESPFFLDYEPYWPRGWLVLNGDTIQIASVTAMVKKGKIKNTKNFYHTGMLLKNGDTTIAALDQLEQPDLVRFSIDLDEADKLSILTFLFVMECYTRFN